MLHSNSNCSEAHEMASEISKLTSELATQAAFKAQQLRRKQDTSEEVRKVPVIPARSSDIARPPPEIPPKRNSLKQIPPEVATSLPIRIPPPLPQKPTTSTKNSPLPNSKFTGKSAPSPIPIEKSTNPFDYPMESSVLQNPTFFGKPNTGVHTNEAKVKGKPHKRQSPTEEYGSEDALRGIESGLRNMERAMQEQMNLRSIEGNISVPNIQMDFKGHGTSVTHHAVGALNQIRNWERNLEQLKLNDDIGGGAAITGTVPQSVICEERKFRQNHQMITGQIDHSSRSNIEHHMRSLDRNLPLELQYSRFRSQQQYQQQQYYQVGPPNSGSNVTQGQMPLSNEFREHIRQQLMGSGGGNPTVPHTGNTPVSPAAVALLQHQAQSRQVAAAAAAAPGIVPGIPNGLSREEIRMRRRSSHDETQMPQIVQGIPVTRLREHWDETSQAALQRSAQLKNMLGDSQRYEAKKLEIEKWLLRMEHRAERMGVVATTADVLEAQHKEQKSFHAELHQNKQQIELFNTLTQKLIAVYPSDDTSRIKKMTESVNVRYANLNNGVIHRGKQLHAALHSLQSFDRTMDQFLAFLSESESLLEGAESDIDRNPLMFRVSHVYFGYSKNMKS